MADNGNKMFAVVAGRNFEVRVTSKQHRWRSDEAVCITGILEGSGQLSAKLPAREICTILRNQKVIEVLGVRRF